MSNSFTKIAAIVLLCLLTISTTIAHPLFSNITGDKDKLVELEVKSIKPYPGEAYVIELASKTTDEDWVLPMVIGGCEAIAVARTKNKTVSARPLTYDLFISVFKETKIKLKHIVITKLEDNTFYANIVLEENGKEIEIDARPSDSINIAMKANVPIYATQSVLDMAKESTR